MVFRVGVGRLAEQKGIDLFSKIIPKVIEEFSSQVIILGTGDKKYHKILERLFNKYSKHRRYKKMFSLYLTFDNILAHRIYAGVDSFLMPSRYEPCGLGQMISLKYGTIPIVKSTGGLVDTICDYTKDSRRGNGFVFEKSVPSSFLNAIKRAHEVFSRKKEWEHLIKKAMKYSFSWRKSARDYILLYNRCLSLR